MDVKAIAEEVTDRWFRNDLPERVRAQSSTRVMLRILVEDVLAAASPVQASAPQRFNVKWGRPDTSDVLACHGLTADLLTFRIRAAIRNYGHVKLLALTPTDDNVSAVSNHVFTCSGCSRQWTVDSDDTLECFFVGLCYWCIRQHRFTKDQIDQCLQSFMAAIPTVVDTETKAKEIVEEYKQRVMRLPSGDAVPCSRWLEMRLQIALDLAAPAPSAVVQDETELTKLRQAIGWICDAADAAYIEDSDNARIHEIFNIAAQAAGITRRLPDEYQRFDESGSE